MNNSRTWFLIGILIAILAAMHQLQKTTQFSYRYGWMLSTLPKPSSNFDFEEVFYEPFQETMEPLEYIQLHFPQCISTTGKIALNTMGSYQLRQQHTWKRYDHSTCFVMKARYNCAHPPQNNGTTPRKASDYELVLNLSNNSATSNNSSPSTSSTAPSQSYCRIGELVEAMGGPGNLNLPHKSELKSDGINNTKPPTKRTILIQGSSFVRQLWESLVCLFSSNITKIMVQEGGPTISLAAFQKRHGKKIQVEELGTRIDNMSRLEHEGCHGPDDNNITKFYDPLAEHVPTRNIYNCNDNIAMVEFDHKVRIHYMFRPEEYEPEAFETVYKEYWGINNATETIDALVYNFGVRREGNFVPPSFQLAAARRQNINAREWLGQLKTIQLRDLGVYFGADNPWITHPPDYHPCMPGIPDDQAHLLLYLLW
eukprot:CAMPEP_0178747746 /NCGR_PEP_ID=MMETSP0744-20121128/8495_1 /TAXON_ID=913974 /ORGANISM="Nitzschia punctata, Strain CCMP561" /LENGTH=425 /DNA_ID=CAMNT_0020401021 /DNA_START=468 /DNA_END=1742 /DNA_ORIENTATION=-